MLNGMIILASETSKLDITTGLDTIMTAGKSVMNFILDDKLLMALFVGSIVGVACKFIRSAKKTAKA